MVHNNKSRPAKQVIQGDLRYGKGVIIIRKYNSEYEKLTLG